MFPPARQGTVCKVPRRALEARFGRVDDVTAVKLRPDNGIVALTSAHPALLPDYAGAIAPAAAATVAHYTLDLIALSLSAATGDTSRRDRPSGRYPHPTCARSSRRD